MNRDDFMRHALPFAAAAAITAIGFAVPAHAAAGRADVLKAQQERIDELRAQVDELSSTNASLRLERTHVVTGSDHTREVSDKHLAEDFLDECATWDSLESYQACRKTAQDKYGIPSDSQFLTSYMAEVEATTLTDGTEYNYIDAEGLNSRVYGFEDFLVAIDGDTYHHFALVTFRTTSNGRNGDAEAIMSYAVDGDGRIIDVEVETL